MTLEDDFPALFRLSMAHSTFDWDAEIKNLMDHAHIAAGLLLSSPNKFTVELKDNDGAPLGDSLPKGHECK